jgi:hypothetical protein
LIKINSIKEFVPTAKWDCGWPSKGIGWAKQRGNALAVRIHSLIQD